MKYIQKNIGLILISLFAFIWAFPMLWVFSMSFRPNEILQVSTDSILPLPFTLKNYLDVLQAPLAIRWLFNSVVVSCSATFLTLILSATSGYALAKIQFIFKKITFVYILIGLLIPVQTMMVPLFSLFTEYNLHNSYTSLITTKLATPLGVFMLYQFFKSFNQEITEAAIMDQANHLQIFWYILLPQTRPALMTLGIFTFLGSWNEYFWTLISSNTPSMYTLTVGIASMLPNHAQSGGLGFIMGSTVVASVPIIIVYIIFQKQILNGINLDISK